jgi:hypothetical protein
MAIGAVDVATHEDEPARSQVEGHAAAGPGGRAAWRCLALPGGAAAPGPQLVRTFAQEQGLPADGVEGKGVVDAQRRSGAGQALPGGAIEFPGVS